MRGQSDVACDLSRKTQQYVALFIDAVEIRFVDALLHAANEPSDMVIECCRVSFRSVTAPLKLSALEVDSTFITVRLLRLRLNIRSGLACLEVSVVTLPDWKVASDKACPDNS